MELESLVRSFDESKKSEKSIASMIVKNKEGEQGQGGGKKEQKKKSVKIAERAEEPQVHWFFLSYFILGFSKVLLLRGLKTLQVWLVQ